MSSSLTSAGGERALSGPCSLGPADHVFASHVIACSNSITRSLPCGLTRSKTLAGRKRTPPRNVFAVFLEMLDQSRDGEIGIAGDRRFHDQPVFVRPSRTACGRGARNVTVSISHIEQLLAIADQPARLAAGDQDVWNARWAVSHSGFTPSDASSPSQRLVRESR